MKNRLLALLSEPDQRRLRPHLEPVDLPYKQGLYEAHQDVEFVYFIEEGVGSLVNTMENGDTAEVGTVGSEGIIGLPILLGDQEGPTSVYIQVPGSGLRMRSKLFRREMERSPTMRAVMLRYVHAFFNQVAQSAACTHFHRLDQRTCRWLLMTADRMDGDEFLLTHEFLAMMLGVRRAGVTEAMGTLQAAGLVAYHHGHVKVRDRHGLEARSCECYRVGKAAYDWLLD